MSFYDKDKIEKASKKVYENATPEQRKVMDAVQVAIDQENADLDARREAETKLRAWAKDLCGYSLDMSEIEHLRSTVQAQKPGIFTYTGRRGRAISLVKTVFGTVDKVERYLLTLENAVIDVTNSSQFTNLGFFGLIKRAFRDLFRKVLKRS